MFLFSIWSCVCMCLGATLPSLCVCVILVCLVGARRSFESNVLASAFSNKHFLYECFTARRKRNMFARQDECTWREKLRESIAAVFSIYLFAGDLCVLRQTYTCSWLSYAKLTGSSSEAVCLESDDRTPTSRAAVACWRRASGKVHRHSPRLMSQPIPKAL